MLKRTLISGMWFVALWSVGGGLHLYLDVPRAVMLAPAIAGAVAIWFGLARYEAWRATFDEQSSTLSTVGVSAPRALNFDPDTAR